MPKLTESELKKAHGYSFKNKEIIKASYICGCFHCLSIFKSKDVSPDCFIPESDGMETVLCPECGIDSVIGDSIGIRINLSLLNAMEAYYFNLINDPWDANYDY